MAKLAEGLDLRSAEDRSIFRLRVARHFSMMKLTALREEAGLGARATRTQAANAVANRWIAEMTG